MPQPSPRQTARSAVAYAASDREDAIGARLIRMERLAQVQAMLAEADLNLDQFTQRLVDELEDLTRASGVVVELVDGGEMTYRSVSSAYAAHRGLRIMRQGSLSGLCVELRDVLLCVDTKGDARVDQAACERTGIRSMICAPLLRFGEAVGVLKICSNTPNAFDGDDVAALRLLSAILGAEMGKQIAFDRSERLLAERTEATLALSREVEERTKLEVDLRANKQRLETMIAHAHQAIVSMASDGTITGWNRHAELTFGWAAHEVIGRQLAGLIIPPDLRAAHAAGMRRFLATGSGTIVGQRIEVEAIRRNGDRFPVELAISAVEGADGWDFTALLHDISERRARVELFENAFNHASIGMALVSLDGRFLKLNEAFAGIIGYAAAEACELDFQRITHPDDLDEDLHLLGQLLGREIDSYHLDKRYFRKCGQIVCVRLSVSLVDDAHGAPKHFIAQVQDLTNERAAEDRYRLMAENATDIILTSDVQGLVTFVSPACEAVTGISAHELVGRRATDFMHPDDVALVQQNWLAAVAERPVERVRCRIEHRTEGHTVWLESNVAPLRGSDDDVVTGVIDVIRDVTRQKESEDALALARSTAEQAMRSKADFLANISHELRTPLNSIIGFSRLLAESEGLEAESKRHVGLLGRAGQALHAVIDNVLDYSKLDAAALSLDPAPFDLPAFVSDTVHLMEPQAAAKDIGVSVDLDPALPRFVSGDAGRLRQVMLNLLSNAIKFTAEGSVAVTLALLDSSDDGARIRVEVADTGTGIAPHKLVRLFKRFAQAGPEVASRYGGTGLGLEITKQLIELMGGEIGVTSDLGKGSTFWFEIRLPFADRLPSLTGQEGPELHLDGKRILVADDVDLNRDLMLAILARYRCRVDVASDGAEALTLVGMHAYDLILMDCQMPVMDGFAATRAIRALVGPRSAIPILALTASTQPEHLARCMAAGMDEYLTKPIDPVVLEATLRRFLSGADGEQAPVEAIAPPPTPTRVPLALRYAERKRTALERLDELMGEEVLDGDRATEAASIAHKLAGTAGMFGDGDFGTIAAEFEDDLARWAEAGGAATMGRTYERLRRAA